MRAHDLDVKSTPLAKHPNLRVKAVGVSIANAGPLRTLDMIFADNGPTLPKSNTSRWVGFSEIVQKWTEMVKRMGHG